MNSETVQDGLEGSWTDQPGTIDDLIADAKERGFPASVRLIHDWVGLGLLDKPVRRSRGNKYGSDKALWSPNQRNLFRTLVDKRPTVKTIASLCNVPVFIWLYYGDDYVPIRQVQKAMRTWAEDGVKTSRKTADALAREGVRHLDDKNASRSQKQRLQKALFEVQYNVQFGVKTYNQEELTKLVKEVFDPDDTGRKLGAPGVSADAKEYVRVLQLRIDGWNRAKSGVSPDELVQARTIYLETRRDYLLARPELQKLGFRPKDQEMFREPTLDETFNRACIDLAFILGIIADVPITND